MWTNTWIYNLRDASTSKSGQFVKLLSKKNKLMSVFHASALLLTMKYAIKLSKLSADPLSYHIVDPQLLWQCYEEIHHRQKQDRCMKNWRQFVKFNESILSGLISISLFKLQCMVPNSCDSHALIKKLLLRTVPAKYKGFCARLGPHGKSRSLQGLLETTKKNRGSHAFFRYN